MGTASYVSVCVLLYCMFVSTVFHYMFRPTWPSSYILGFCFAAFFYVVILFMFLICVLFLCCFLSSFLVFSCLCNKSSQKNQVTDRTEWKHLRRNIQLSSYPQGFTDSDINSKGSSHLNKNKKPLGFVYITYVKCISETLKCKGN
jgi:hypothetical protein